MPQTFQVLRCYKCAVFQVHPTKKANKWNCKLCGEKQSLKRFYGLGTGKECRLHVQKLNGIRGELGSQFSSDTEDPNSVSDSSDLPSQEDAAKKSKWTDYMDPKTEEQEPNCETMHLNNMEVVSELPKKLSTKHKHIDKTKIQKETECATENPVPARVLNSHTNNAVNCMESNKTTDVCESKPLNKVIHNFIPPVISNSRWAQFVEPQEERQCENDENDIHPNVQTSAADVPFLEDEDLDSILKL